MKKIIALVLVLGLSSLFAADVATQGEAAVPVKAEKKAKVEKKAKKVKKAKKAKKEAAVPEAAK